MAIAGWTAIDSNSGHDLAWASNANSLDLRTPFGGYFVDLSGYTDAVPYVGLSQTISLNVGTAYVLSFDLGVDQGSSLYSGPIGVTASVGSTTQTFTGYNPAGTGNIWQSFSLDFVASSSNTTISITGLQGYQYIGLDNVAINVVPEPSTWATLGLGLASVYFVVFCRQRAA